MTLDDATVRRIAKLARLHVDDADVVRLQGELSGILGWIEQLAEVDVSGVETLGDAGGDPGAGVRLRPDVVTTDCTGGGRAELVLGNAPDREGGFYTVPKVVE